MFPTTAGYNSPGSSFDIDANRQGLANSIVNLFGQINSLPYIIDPNFTNIVTPTLPNALGIGLPGGQFELNGRIVTIAPAYLPMLLATELVFSGAVVGNNNLITDYSSSSSFTRQYVNGIYGSLALGPTTTGAAPLAITPTTLSLVFSLAYVGNGGYTISLLDQVGSGYQIAISPSKVVLYNSVASVASGAALAGARLTSATNLAITQRVTIEITQNPQPSNLTYSYTLTVYLNKTSPLFSYTGTTTALPAMIPVLASTGNMYMYDWNWSFSDATPVVAWQMGVYGYGTMTPAPRNNAQQFFQVSIGETSVIGIRPLFYKNFLSTKLAAAKDTLEQLQAAYN